MAHPLQRLRPRTTVDMLLSLCPAGEENTASLGMRADAVAGRRRVLGLRVTLALEPAAAGLFVRIEGRRR